MPDQATYSALQNAFSGSIATAGAVTRTTPGGMNGRRRLLDDSSGNSSNETVLPASAVGTWTNCSATCTYEVGRGRRPGCCSPQAAYTACMCG